MRQLQLQRRARNRKYKHYRKYNLKRKRNCNRNNPKGKQQGSDQPRLAQRRRRREPSRLKAPIHPPSLSSTPVMAATILAVFLANAFRKK